MKLPGLDLEIDEEMEKKIAIAAGDVGEIFLAHNLPRHIGVMTLCRLLAYCLLDYPDKVRDIVRRSVMLGIAVAMDDREPGSSGIDVGAEIERLIQEVTAKMRKDGYTPRQRLRGKHR